MRKKLLSLLTVLCLVLGMLPATAMAIDTTNIDKTDAENVMVVAEDTELTGTIEKLVLVDAAVKVDVTDATLTVGLVVSPDAEGAEVTISGTTAAEVVVLANASVKTDEATTVQTVTVDAAAATVEVAGEVASVVLTENAEGVTLTVAETATVAAVEVAAPNATVEVSGTVESVAVAATATATELVVSETATVAAVTDATGGLTVSGAGAESVAVENTAESTEGEEDKDTEDEETEDGEDAAQDEENNETPSTGDNFGDIVLPPVTDEGEGDEGEGGDQGDTGDTTAPKITWGGVECEAGKSAAVTANSVAEHSDGYWVKFAIANPDTTKYNMVVKVGNTEITADNGDFWLFDVSSLVTAAEATAAENFVNADGNAVYDTENSEWKLAEDKTAPKDASVTVKKDEATTVTVTLTEKAAAGGDENADITTAADDAGEEYTYTFNVTVDASVTVDLTDAVNTALGEKEAPISNPDPSEDPT